MEHTGLTIPEAVKDLAQSCGLTVPQEQSMRGGGGVGGEGYAPAPSKAVSVALTEVMQTACEFYRKQLRGAPNAIEYLKKRGSRARSRCASGSAMRRTDGRAWKRCSPTTRTTIWWKRVW